MGSSLDALASLLPIAFAVGPRLAEIVGLSLRVSLTAALLATAIGIPLASVLAMRRFAGRTALVLLSNALLGLPPVVVGLALYLLLSRSGVFGFAGLLYTPAAMIIAQTALAVPIVTALAHRALEPLWATYGDILTTDGAGFGRSARELLSIGRNAILTTFLAAFGRAIAEVGAIMMVGGNIRGFTRTMTTTIALETTRGDLALALSLGCVLIVLSIAVSSGAFFITRWSSIRGADV